MKRLTRREAIKKFCYQCAGENRAEVTRCPATQCPLYPYRKGTEMQKNTTKQCDLAQENDF